MHTRFSIPKQVLVLVQVQVQVGRWQCSKHMAFVSDGVTETAFAFYTMRARGEPFFFFFFFTIFTFQKGVIARLRVYNNLYPFVFFRVLESL